MEREEKECDTHQNSLQNVFLDLFDFLDLFPVETQGKVSHGTSTIKFYPISTNFRKGKRVRQADEEIRYANSGKFHRDSPSYDGTAISAGATDVEAANIEATVTTYSSLYPSA